LSEKNTESEPIARPLKWSEKITSSIQCRLCGLKIIKQWQTAKEVQEDKLNKTNKCGMDKQMK